MSIIITYTHFYFFFLNMTLISIIDSSKPNMHTQSYVDPDLTTANFTIETKGKKQEVLHVSLILVLRLQILFNAGILSCMIIFYIDVYFHAPFFCLTIIFYIYP